MMDAQEIRELRQRLGLTQIELAERLGTSQRVVTRWENGEHKPIRAFVTIMRDLESGARTIAEPEPVYDAG